MEISESLNNRNSINYGIYSEIIRNHLNGGYLEIIINRYLLRILEHIEKQLENNLSINGFVICKDTCDDYKRSIIIDKLKSKLKFLDFKQYCTQHYWVFAYYPIINGKINEPYIYYNTLELDHEDILNISNIEDKLLHVNKLFNELCIKDNILDNLARIIYVPKNPCLENTIKIILENIFLSKYTLNRDLYILCKTKDNIVDEAIYNITSIEEQNLKIKIVDLNNKDHYNSIPQDYCIRPIKFKIISAEEVVNNKCIIS